MPKRKGVSKNNPEHKKQRVSAPGTCPQLPQELWDRIIGFSIGFDPVLGPLPNEVDQVLGTPFLRFNRACRQQVLSSISSLTWIEIKPHDHSHTNLAQQMSKGFALVESCCARSFLRKDNVSRVVLELGNRVIRKRTRQQVRDTQSFFSIYSYASMLRLLCEINDAHCLQPSLGPYFLRG